MAKETIVPNQGIRERHVNIIYFIDSSKSYSIRINLVLARWLLAGSVGLIVWSLLSIGWIISLGKVLDATRSNLSQTLSSIFDYQVKYDKVFESAYPDPSNVENLKTVGAVDTEKNALEAVHLASGKTSPAQVKPEASQQTVAQDETPKATEANNSSVDVDRLIQEKPSTQPAIKQQEATFATTTSLTMDIKNPSLKADKGKMTLLFDISNMSLTKKAEGYIWAIATIEMPNGTTKKIAAPSHSRLKADGTIDKYSSTYKFSIQKFKRKDFSFAVPTDENWKVSDLKITYVDTHGQTPQTIQVTTPVEFLKSKGPEGSQQPNENNL